MFTFGSGGLTRGGGLNIIILCSELRLYNRLQLYDQSVQRSIVVQNILDIYVNCLSSQVIIYIEEPCRNSKKNLIY